MPLSASRIGSVPERPAGSTNWFTRLEALLGRIWRCLSQWGIREQTNLHHGQLITHYWGSRVPFPSDQFNLAAIQNASACHFCSFLWNCAITRLSFPSMTGEHIGQAWDYTHIFLHHTLLQQFLRFKVYIFMNAICTTLLNNFSLTFYSSPT